MEALTTFRFIFYYDSCQRQINQNVRNWHCNWFPCLPWHERTPFINACHGCHISTNHSLNAALCTCSMSILVEFLQCFKSVISEHCCCFLNFKIMAHFQTTKISLTSLWTSLLFNFSKYIKQILCIISLNSESKVYPKNLSLFSKILLLSILFCYLEKRKLIQCSF